MKRIFIFMSVALAGMLTACSGDEPADNGGSTDSGVTPVIELTAEANEAAAAVWDFNIDFFRNVALADNYKGKNVACSPLSATMLLSMLSNAASDEAATEIASVLGYSGTDELNELYATLATKLPSLDPKAQLAFANSVWYEQKYTLKSDFSNIAQEYYKADIFRRDMTGKSPNVKDEINSWVNDKTKGLIRNISVSFPMLSSLFNATYFKAEWRDPFKTENTKKATFHGQAGDSQIDMMNCEGGYLYEPTPDYEALELPFGAGAFNATFILPTGDIEEFIESDALKGLWSYEPKKWPVNLFLPKFKIAGDNEVLLTGILRDMGVKSILDPEHVNLFNESPEAESISVFQKTSIEFNERGAEAAAVTGILVNTAPPVRRVSFDRPFLFLITEKSTKTILFAGKIMNL